MEYAYNGSIIIMGAEGTHSNNAVPVSDSKAKKFIKGVRNSLDKLGKLGTGRALLNEISASGKTCKIFLGAFNTNKQEFFDCCAQAEQPGMQAEVDCTVVSFRPRHLNLPIAGSSYFKASRAVNVPPVTPKKKSDDEVKYKQELRLLGNGALQTRDEAASELNIVLWRAGNKNLARGRQLASMLTGVSTQHLAEMARGERIISDNVYYKLCFYFYDSLSAGPGVDTCVRMIPALRLESLDVGYKPKKDSSAVAPEIIMGHELIHAWRMMVGRRVVRQGWEEEAMTTGLGIFAPWRFTENRLRSEGGYPPRTKYTNGVVSSYFGLNMKQSTELKSLLDPSYDTY